jgi:hypothetical protein
LRTRRFQANPESSLKRFVARMWRFGYLCYVFTPKNFVPLTGAWWHPALEFKRWSNIFCGVGGDPGLELLLRRVNWIYAPPVSKCLDDVTYYRVYPPSTHIKPSGDGAAGAAAEGPTGARQ